METKKLKIEYRGIVAEDNRSKLYVPHLNSKITFLYPPMGPNSYARLANELERNGAIPASLSELLSLIEAAWEDPEENHSNEVINLLRKDKILISVGLLYVPEEGVFIEDLPETNDRTISMNRSKLIKKLELNDKSVRFVGFKTYKSGTVSVNSLSKNNLVKILIGEDSMEKLSKIASMYKANPYFSFFENIEKERIGIVAICSDQFDNRIHIGDIDPLSRDNYTFGLLKQGVKTLESQVGQIEVACKQKISRQSGKRPFIDCLSETIDFIREELEKNTENEVNVLNIVKSGVNRVKDKMSWGSYKLLYTMRKDGVTGYVPGLFYTLRTLIDRSSRGLKLIYRDKELSNETPDLEDQLKSLVIDALPEKTMESAKGSYDTKRSFGPLDNISSALKEFIKNRIMGEN